MCGEQVSSERRRAARRRTPDGCIQKNASQGSPSFSQFSNVIDLCPCFIPPAADLQQQQVPGTVCGGAFPADDTHGVRGDITRTGPGCESVGVAAQPTKKDKPDVALAVVSAGDLRKRTDAMSSSNLNAASPSRVVRRSTSEHAETLRFEHQNILKKIHQYGRLADTTAAKPADLQRQMAAMEAEQEAERERLEDARRRAQSDGESIVAQLEIAKLENAGLRDQLEIARAENAQARRSVEVSIEKQVDLKRDLQSALSELETLRLELSLLRPYEVKPLPAAAAQLENPELQPPPRSVSTGPGASPRGGGSSMGACARPSTAYGHTGAGSAHGQQRPGMRRTDARTLSPEPEPNPSPHPNPNPSPSPSPSPCPTDSLTLTRT